LMLGAAAFLLTARTSWRIGLWAALALLLTAVILFLPQRRGVTDFPLVASAVWVLGLIAVVLAYRFKLAQRYGSSVGVVALGLVVVYWGALSLFHARALERTGVMAASLAVGNGETVTRTAAMPTLANPLRWQAMAETDRATYRYFISLGEDGSGPKGLVRYEKPQGGDARAVERASEDRGATVFLEFARFPVFQVEGDCASRLLVQLADLRYTEPGPGTRGSFALTVPVECEAEAATALKTGASHKR